MDRVQSRTQWLLAALLIAAGWFLFYNSWLLAAGWLDVMPRMRFPGFAALLGSNHGSDIPVPFLYSCQVFALMALLAACAVLSVPWLAALWNERKLPGRKFSYLFWLILIPGAGLLLYGAVLAVLAWRRGWLAFAATLLYLALLIPAAAAIAEAALWHPVIAKMCGTHSRLFAEHGIGFGLTVLAYAKLAAAVAAGLLILLVPRISGVEWPAWARWLGWPLVCGAVIFVAAAYLTMDRVDRRVAALEAKLAALGVPFGDDALARFYFRGEQPNAEWSAYVDRLANIPEDDPNPLAIFADMAWPPDITARDAAAFEKLRTAFADNRELLLRLDGIFPENGAPVKYAARLDGSSIAQLLLPQLGYLRGVCQIYCGAIVLATHDRDGAEALRLCRHLFTVLDTAQGESLLIGALVYVSGLSMTGDAIADLLAARVLTDEQLAWLEAELAKREAGLREAMVDGFRWEAASTISICEQLRECSYGSPREVARPLRNPAWAPAYCYIGNEQAFMLDFYRRMLELITAPDFDPVEKMAVLEGFEAERDPLKDYRVMMSIGLGELAGKPSSWERPRVVALLLPSPTAPWLVVLRTQAKLRMLRIACEVEMFRLKNRRPPASLEELSMPDMPLDPFSAKPFSYQTGKLVFLDVNGDIAATATGYRLYGVGDDCKDGGGWTIIGSRGWDDVVSVVDPGSIVAAAPTTTPFMMPGMVSPPWTLP